ncbi:MAG: c-type cytochrome [Bacteroidetes bacterium]|nr:c-type cytochrome [Bacteroidota bacterium]
MKLIYQILFFCCLLFIFSCKVDPKIATPLPDNTLYEQIPQGWPTPVYRFSNNPITVNKFVLGRQLFYDPILSSDNSIACADCHQQFAAFSNLDHPVSHGVNGSLGKRNAPALFNLTWHPLMMHDGGILSLELQPLAPITNTLEMNLPLTNAWSKLQSSKKYQSLFKAAFGDSIVSTERVEKSFAIFMAMMYSNTSRYDYYKAGKNNVQFNSSEQRGYTLFIQNCAQCHKEPLFSDYAFRNNGIGVDPYLNDIGRAKITQLPQDQYKFKTPTLRNIAFTRPYMHDGRFNTLQECLDHYTAPATNTINLDPSLATPMNLSAQDKNDIINFLYTLSDYNLLSDERFANPNP